MAKSALEKYLLKKGKEDKLDKEVGAGLSAKPSAKSSAAAKLDAHDDSENYEKSSALSAAKSGKSKIAGENKTSKFKKKRGYLDC